MTYIIYDECEEVTTEAWNSIVVKYGSIEDRIVMQMKSAIMDYVSKNKLDEEGLGKKRKPYYRRGRWE